MMAPGSYEGSRREKIKMYQRRETQNVRFREMTSAISQKEGAPTSWMYWTSLFSWLIFFS